ATADSSTLLQSRATARGVNARIARASSTDLPRMWSQTRRALRAELLTYLACARTRTGRAWPSWSAAAALLAGASSAAVALALGALLALALALGASSPPASALLAALLAAALLGAALLAASASGTLASASVLSVLSVSSAIQFLVLAAL